MAGTGPGTVWFVGVGSARSAACIRRSTGGWQRGRLEPAGRAGQEHRQVTHLGRVVLAEEGVKSLGVKAK